MPEEVRWAKEVKDLIGRRALIGDVEEEYNMNGKGTFFRWQW